MSKWRYTLKKVPGSHVDGDVLTATHSSDADNDAQTEHGDQGDTLAERNLDTREIFCWPKGDKD
jgi:hypothetical protein